MRIAMAQLNLTVGDIEGNTTKTIEALHAALAQKAQIVVYPELTVCGYSPRDLILNRSFIEQNLAAIQKIAAEVPAEIVAVAGFIDRIGDRLYNSAAVMQAGKIVAKRYKTLLPNYDVFDEKRYFTSAESNVPVTLEIDGQPFRLGVEICEDLWDSNNTVKITADLAAQGCDLVVNLSASPFEIGKRNIRRELIWHKVRDFKVPFVLVNLIGGQDELIFDGNSLVFSVDGRLVGHAGAFEERIEVCELDVGHATEFSHPNEDRAENLYKALVLGVRDYFRKTGFRRAVIGLSGGIDSALVACIAREALGAANVQCVSMPSRFTAQMSIDDARTLAERLGLRFELVAIDAIAKSYEDELAPLFSDAPRDITEENIQSRVRGNILMAVANKFGDLVLATGNKTEIALGYCTMYGDMAGALAVIGDLNKSDVYLLADYINRNAGKPVIPQRIIDRPPSAELTENQVDPFDYEVVSPLVGLIINEHKIYEELVALGYAEELVSDIMNKIRIAEYKRHQSAPVLKVTAKAFGIGRRFPIVNQFRR